MLKCLLYVSCFSLSSQVYVDKHFVGVLDYRTHELSLPDGKVACVCVCASELLHLFVFIFNFGFRFHLVALGL